MATSASVGGTLERWGKVELDFSGPRLAEAAATFSDYRLDVTFRHAATGETITVPGFFAADGDAGDTGATSGTVWRAIFNPPLAGEWTYDASFRTGRNVAASLDPAAGQATAFDKAHGAIAITAASVDPGDGAFRTQGMVLQAEGEHYLAYSGSGGAFIKAGTNSPENFLAYSEFDGTRHDGPKGLLHDYDAHLRDWNAGDPTWGGGRGKEIIGAVNYLAEKGLNDIYMLTMNLKGDAGDVWPWAGQAAGDRRVYDVSKLDQWETVFQHMDDKGMMIHAVLQEQENDQLLGGLTIDRMIYYRELVARFGHHNGLVWTIGEESTNTTAEQKAFASYIKAVDPYDHLVDIHTFPADRAKVFDPLIGYDAVDGASLQITDGVRGEVAKWIDKSTAAGDPWVVSWDEVGPASSGMPEDGAKGAAARQTALRADMWGALTAGAGGIEWYAGGQDQSLENFRTRDSVWTWTAAASDFFEKHLPVMDMKQADALTTGTTGNDYVIAQAGNVYAVYLPKGGTATLDLTGHAGTFDVSWFDPRHGGDLVRGTVSTVIGGGAVNLGLAPVDGGADGRVLGRHAGGAPATPTPMMGTNGKDSLYGTASADDIHALAGNDRIDGRGGDDVLRGGDGNDSLTGGRGSDWLDGGNGLDTAVFTGSAADYL
ncbi:MAG: DUF5060 domain-containing protein, partial [Sphingomonas sp.]